MINYIMSNSSIYERLISEIDDATRAEHLSATPQYDEVRKHCPYYIACVKETLRLCPAAPSIFPRIVDTGGMMLHGMFVPEGMEIACNPWLVHRDVEIYGEDAHIYCPERWLDSDKAKLYEKYNMTFGYGTRVCLGRDIAMMELYKGPLLVISVLALRRMLLADRSLVLSIIQARAGGHQEAWKLSGPRDRWSMDGHVDEDHQTSTGRVREPQTLLLIKLDVHKMTRTLWDIKAIAVQQAERIMKSSVRVRELRS